MILFYKNSLTKENYLKCFLLAALLSVLTPYLYISFFTHPIADDYCFAFLEKDVSFLKGYIHLFFNMGGRYITNALIFLNPIAFHNITLYKFIPLFQILIALFSFYYFFRALTSRAMSRINSLNAALLFLLLYLFQMPCLAEGIYNYGASVNYHLGIIVAVLYFGLLVDYFMKHYFIHRFFHCFIGIFLLAITIGFSEVITLVLLSLHLLILFQYFVKREKIKTEWWILFFTCTFFSFIMFASPGNAERSLNYPDNHNFFRSLSFSLMQVCRFGLDWISVPVLLLSIAFIGTVSSLRNKMPFFLQEYFLNPWASALLLAWILFVCVFPPYWATNILGQQRTVNVACFFFLLYWFICIGFYVNIYFKNWNLSFLANKKLQVLISACVICIFICTKNGYAVFTDILYNRVEKFDNQMQQRFDTLSIEANKNKIVYLKPLSEKPKSLFVLDLSADSGHWINYCQAKYFGVKTIVCKE